MSFSDFDDSLDDILANITTSQLDPSLKNRSEGNERHKSIETQTECTFDYNLNTNLKRKLVLIETNKHHHKYDCVYHKKSPLNGINKKFKSINGNQSQTNFNESINDWNSSSYLGSMSTKEFNQSNDVTNEDNGSQNGFPSDWDLLSNSNIDDINEKSSEVLATN